MKNLSMFENMEKIMFMDGEPFKARAYSKAKETVMLHDNSISSKDVEGKNDKGGSIKT